MKLFLALFATFCLITSPALAGITALSGTTNGLLATGTTAATSVTSAATTVDIPSGSLIIISAAYRAASGTLSCTDNLGTHNTYNNAAAQAVYGTTTQTFYAYTTQDTPSGTTFTCNSTGASVNFSIIASAWTGAATSSQYDTGVTAGNSTASSPGPVGPTSTLACNSSAGELMIVSVGFTSTLTLTTEGSGFTLVSGPLGSDALRQVFQIVNSNAAVTYSPTFSGTSAWMMQLQGFKAATCNASAAKHSLLLTGVGE
jgi:hypothetical protein